MPCSAISGVTETLIGINVFLMMFIFITGFYQIPSDFPSVSPFSSINLLRRMRQRVNLLKLLDTDLSINTRRVQVKLHSEKKPPVDLTIREVANKIIHSSKLEWQLPSKSTSSPLLICYSKESEKWTCAMIDIVAVASFCGMLAR